jgi:guanine nucleotide-binding protein alpha-1 subunit
VLCFYPDPSFHRSGSADDIFCGKKEDILHARIQTIGVAEHIFDVHVNGRTVPWHLYDVGGARGQRHTWAPYFDDANAIIFVAPVSAFDQVSDIDLFKPFL